MRRWAPLPFAHLHPALRHDYRYSIATLFWAPLHNNATRLIIMSVYRDRVWVSTLHLTSFLFYVLCLYIRALLYVRSRYNIYIQNQINSSTLYSELYLLMYISNNAHTQLCRGHAKPIFYLKFIGPWVIKDPYSQVGFTQSSLNWPKDTVRLTLWKTHVTFEWL